ncbi:TIGR01906 family membrane protein [Streptococcus hillyeri]|uniref:TIGR01906 family membrane protein n=1 Tax=Streptococcus hillyeri TaxID=2282420 RepID=A0A3L9DYA6_9STRE|nr:TIGR01906 family membrane protein [Streptococcus hillyeri]RLY05278.1 TIGR01906 family membrane protein [Streptococcus hillyeri]
MKTRLYAYLTVLWLLAMAVLGTIYGAWLLYPLEVDWLKLTNQVIITKAELLHNFNVLMVYLTSPFSQVLDMPDFPSSASGLKHFADVKLLFHLTQVIAILTTLPALLFFKSKDNIFHQKVFLGAAFVPVVVGLMGVMIGFENFFTLFHQVLFPGDSSWLFNPATDPIIWVLPETFFLHCFILFFALYESLMLGLFFWCRKINSL